MSFDTTQLYEALKDAAKRQGLPSYAKLSAKLTVEVTVIKQTPEYWKIAVGHRPKPIYLEKSHPKLEWLEVPPPNLKGKKLVGYPALVKAPYKFLKQRHVLP